MQRRSPQNSVRQNDKLKFVSVPLRSTNEKLIMINYFWNVKHVAYSYWIVSTVWKKKQSDTLNKSIIDVTRTLEKQINCAWSTFIVCKMRDHLTFFRMEKRKTQKMNCSVNGIWCGLIRSGARAKRKKNPIKYIDGFEKIYRLSWKRSTSLWKKMWKTTERRRSIVATHVCLFTFMISEVMYST